MKSTLSFAITASAITISIFSLIPPGTPASAAPDNCLSAPNAQAPVGSHWYYRLERGTQRKCWRLVKKDQKEQNAKAASQPEGDDADDDAPAPAPAAKLPAAKMPTAIMPPPARAAAPTPSANTMEAAQPASAPPIRNLVTRNVSNTDDLIQPAPAADSAAPADASAAPSQPAAAPEPAPQPAAAQPAVQPAVATQAAAAPDTESMPTLKLLLLAIAITGLLAGLIFFVMELLRRRSDVLNRTHDADPDGVPYESAPDMAYDTPSVSPPEAGEARPTFEPLPALTPVGEREDSIEDALRRMHARRRRAA